LPLESQLKLVYLGLSGNGRSDPINTASVAFISHVFIRTYANLASPFVTLLLFILIKQIDKTTHGSTEPLLHGNAIVKASLCSDADADAILFSSPHPKGKPFSVFSLLHHFHFLTYPLLSVS